MKIVFAGGKSGGHLVPALAIAERLSDSGHSSFFFAADHSLDKKILKGEPYEKFFFNIYHWKKRFFLFFISNFIAFYRAQKIMRRHNIDALVATGGFISVPLTLAAFFLKKPCIIIELNVIPGKANRFLAHFVDKVCLGFLKTEKYWTQRKSIHKKMEYTGIPVRKSFFECKNFSKKLFCQKRKWEETQPIILVIGGSQGAKALNRVIPLVVSHIPKIQWIHLTGVGNEKELRSSYKKKDFSRVYLQAFSRKIYELMAVSDLVISRSGGNVLAEIKFLEKKALLIPLKSSPDNHQWFNAMHCEKEGWAVCMEESEDLFQKIIDFLKRYFTL